MYVCLYSVSFSDSFFAGGDGAVLNAEWSLCFPTNICSHSEVTVYLALPGMMQVLFRTDM